MNCPQGKKSGGYKKSSKVSQIQRCHGLTNKLIENLKFGLCWIKKNQKLAKAWSEQRKGTCTTPL